jgi:Arc/MetJ family transcription regulator
MHTKMSSLHLGIGRAGKLRTNIDIDDRLVREAMRSSLKPIKRDALEARFRLLVQTQAQAKIRRLRADQVPGRPGCLAARARVQAGRDVVIVETTVWIECLGGVQNAEVDWRDREVNRQRLGLTAVILCEVLQGIRDDVSFGRVLRELPPVRGFQGKRRWTNDRCGTEFPETPPGGLHRAQNHRLLDCHVLHSRTTFASAQGSGLRSIWVVARFPSHLSVRGPAICAGRARCFRYS